WQVKTSDAHAWPELYFPGAGWLRFEPTPPNTLGQPGQATASAPPYSIPLSDTGSTSNSQPGLKIPGDRNAPKTIPGGGVPGLNRLKRTDPTGAAGLGANRRHGTPPIVPVALALLAVALVAPATMRVLGRRWRWWRAQDDISRAHVAWHELRNHLTDYRISYRAS